MGGGGALELHLSSPTALSKVAQYFLACLGCVYHHTSGVELKFPNGFQGDFFADDKRKAVLIRGLETPFFCFYAF